MDRAISCFKIFKNMYRKKKNTFYQSGKSTISYDQLLENVKQKNFLMEKLFGRSFPKGARIGFLMDPSVNFVVSFLSVWNLMGTCVPLSLDTPFETIKKISTSLNLKALAMNDGTVIKLPPNAQVEGEKKLLYTNCPLILLTSGTTGSPKGVLYNGNALEHQIKTLTDAWEWTENDHILHFLPVHHIHGLVNKLLCPLFVGAKITFGNEKFYPETFYDIVMENSSINIFMAVPNMFAQICGFFSRLEKDKKKLFQERLKRFRLFVSGSSPLPEKVFNEWRDITGKELVERYGLTECGMVLSNSVNSPCYPGTVGRPLSGVNIKLSDNELLVKSNGLFDGYIIQKDKNRTEEIAHDPTSWFRTGDIVSYDKGINSYRILGRKNFDFVQINGIKTSLPGIERLITAFPDVKEAAVKKASLGSLDYAKAFIVPENKEKFDVGRVNEYLRNELEPHCVPRKTEILSFLPRNEMGKLLRNQLD